MSDAFAYLSVLLSIILGLAIAEILQGYRSLLLSRSRVKLYVPSLIWSGVMLLLAVQFWWASFGLASRQNWDFAAFAAVLLQSAVLYMGSTLVLPDVEPDQPIDLKAHYYREVAPFFAFGLLFIVLGFARIWLLEDHVKGINIVFMIFFAGVSIIALLIRQPRVHEIIAPIMATVITVFIGLMFARLAQ